MVKTNERFQPSDCYEVDVNKKPTDDRLSGLKVGKVYKFLDRGNTVVGVVGGFSSINSNVEQVFVKPNENGIKEYKRYRADEIEDIEEIKIKFKSKNKRVKEIKTKKKTKKK